MSAYDTITGLRVECPYCKKPLGCFQSECFLGWDLEVPVKEFEQEMDRWNEGWYQCYVRCEHCNKSFDLVYHKDSKTKYTLYEINPNNPNYNNSFDIEVEYE